MKKPDAVTVISRENYKQKVWPLPISDLLFVGRKTCEKLKSCGIHTIGDITDCDDITLKRLLGKNGVELKKYALGEDNSPVVTPTENDKPKSIGKTITCEKDFTENSEVKKAFFEFAQYICDCLHQKKLYAGGVQVHIRTSNLVVKEFSKTFADSTDSALIFATRGFELFCENYSFGEPLRSVGLRAINLKDNRIAVQQDLFGESDKKLEIEKLDNSIYEIRKKFGSDQIKRATTLD